MKHREARSREVEKHRLHEAIHLVRKMRRCESKAFANFNPQDILTFMAWILIQDAHQNLCYSSNASFSLLYLRPLIHTSFFAAPKPRCLFLFAGDS